jgi:hypothetical protein
MKRQMLVLGVAALLVFVLCGLPSSSGQPASTPKTTADGHFIQLDGSWYNLDRVVLINFDGDTAHFYYSPGGAPSYDVQKDSKKLASYLKAREPK